MNDDLRKKYKIKDGVKGVVIVGVDANSAAAEKRLNAGDVIVKVTDEEVSDRGRRAEAHRPAQEGRQEDRAAAGRECRRRRALRGADAAVTTDVGFGPSLRHRSGTSTLMQPRREARFAFVQLTQAWPPASLAANILREATMLRRLVMAAACLLLSVQLGTADEKTKGKLSIWLGYPETLDAFKLGQAEFKKKYPNVDVEILTFELREFEAKLAVSVPAGSGPDILALHDFIFPRYYEGGSLADMPADLAQVVNNQGDHRYAVPGHRHARRQALGPAVVVRPQRPVLQHRSSAGGRAQRPAEELRRGLAVCREADAEERGGRAHPRRHLAAPHRPVRRHAEIRLLLLSARRRADVRARQEARHRAGDDCEEHRRRGARAARSRRASAWAEEVRRLGAQARRAGFRVGRGRRCSCARAG